MLPRDPLAQPELLVHRVYAYAAYRVGDGPDAEDVTSETFERGLRYRGSYDPAKGKPVAWLIGIARRVIDDRLEHAALESPLEPPEGITPGDLEQATVDRLALSEALGALDARDRELIALRYGADLTARQIGEVVGSRTNAVEVALHRALARLRVLLEDGERERKRGRSADGAHVRVPRARRYSG
jgi:RNA polymerase sigma factor (sigma-70 family)